jgi:hypothetical protein
MCVCACVRVCMGVCNGLASQVTDLTPMDLFLWSHIKALIYMLPIGSEEDLTARIVETQQP